MPSRQPRDGQDDARMMGLGVRSRHMPMMSEHSGELLASSPAVDCHDQDDTRMIYRMIARMTNQDFRSNKQSLGRGNGRHPGL